MYECITSKFVSCSDDEISTSNEVVVTYQVSCAADYRDIFVRFTGEAEDVRSLFLNLSESFCCSRNSLVDYDSLHLRVIGKAYDDGDCCFLLIHEVVRICDMLDHSAIFDSAILGDESFSTSKVIFTL